MFFNCAAFAVIYFLILSKFPFITYVYTAIAAIFGFIYVIYNRGFSGKGITPEMLPDTMTAEQKQEFIEDGQRRLKKSRPLLMVVFAFAFTFIMDIISLFALPFLSNIFS